MRRTRMHELVPSCNDWRQEKSLQKNAPRTLNCSRSMPPVQVAHNRILVTEFSKPWLNDIDRYTVTYP